MLEKDVEIVVHFAVWANRRSGWESVPLSLSLSAWLCVVIIIRRMIVGSVFIFDVLPRGEVCNAAAYRIRCRARLLNTGRCSHDRREHLENPVDQNPAHFPCFSNIISLCCGAVIFITDVSLNKGRCQYLNVGVVGGVHQSDPRLFGPAPFVLASTKHHAFKRFV